MPLASLSLKLKIALPGADGTSGNLKDVPDAQGTSRPTSSSPPTANPMDLVSADALTRYQNAKTLFQMVRLMNRSITDAASRKDCRAYIVTLQISLMPYGHALPYDAYSSVSFFSGERGAGVSPTGTGLTVPRLQQILSKHDCSSESPAFTYAKSQARKAVAMLKTLQSELPYPADNVKLNTCAVREDFCQHFPKLNGSELDSAVALYEALVAAGTKEFMGDTKKGGVSNPIVVPLLSTDNMEATSDIRAAEEIQELSFALAGMISGMGIGAALDNYSKFRTQAAGHNLNSLLTVGRLSDNTIQIRLGAVQRVRSEYAMVPQTHSIAVPVLVPKEVISCDSAHGAAIRFVSRTVFRETDKPGKPPLKVRSTEQMKARFLEAVQNYAPRFRLRDGHEDHQRDLLATVQSNDFPGFLNVLQCRPCFAGFPVLADHYAEALWTDLTRLWIGSQYAQSVVYLPVRDPEITVGSQTLILTDDGKSATQVLIKGGRNLKRGGFTAKLSLSCPTNSLPYLLVADSVEPVADDRLRLTFPSLAALRLSTNAALMELTLDGNKSPLKWCGRQLLYQLVERRDTVQASSTKVSARPGRLVASKGQASLELHVEKNGRDAAFLEIADALVEAVQPLLQGVLGEPKGFDYPVLGTGTVRLSLSGLSDHGELRIQLKDKDGNPNGKPIAIPISVQ